MVVLAAVKHARTHWPPPSFARISRLTNAHWRHHSCIHVLIWLTSCPPATLLLVSSCSWILASWFAQVSSMPHAGLGKDKVHAGTTSLASLHSWHGYACPNRSQLICRSTTKSSPCMHACIYYLNLAVLDWLEDTHFFPGKYANHVLTRQANYKH